LSAASEAVGGPALDTALVGVDTVLHCASSPRGGDEAAARNLIAAARRAGVGHLVHISTVGVDRVQGRVSDMGGPEIRTLDSRARSFLRVRGKRRLVVRVPLWGAAYRAFRAGAHLTPERAVGKGTFEEYLRR